MDEKELGDGVRCLAAPIKDEQGKVIGALIISGRTGSMKLEKFRQCTEPILKVAINISRQLGYEAEHGELLAQAGM